MLLNLVLNGANIKHLYDAIGFFRWYADLNIFVEFHSNKLLIYKYGDDMTSLYRICMMNDKFNQFQCEIPNQRILIPAKNLLSVLSVGFAKFDELVIRMTDINFIEFIKKGKTSTVHDRIKIKKYDSEMLTVQDIEFKGTCTANFIKVMRYHLPKSGYLKIDVDSENLYLTTKDKYGNIGSHIIKNHSIYTASVDSNATFRGYFAIDDKTYIKNFRELSYALGDSAISIYFAHDKRVLFNYTIGGICDVKYIQHPITLADGEKFQNAYMTTVSDIQNVSDVPAIVSGDQLDESDINQVWI